MPIIELNKLLADLKGGEFEGRYIFAGEEEYLVRHYLGALAAAVVQDDSLSAFNHIVYDGPEIDFAELTDAVKAPPMMSEYKLVEWRYADFSKMKESELSALEQLVEEHKDHPYTVLAFSAIAGSFDFGTPKKQGKLLSRFGKDFRILRFERSTDKQLYAWLERHFTSQKIKVSLATVTAMVDRIGRSMDMLKGEVDKLVAYAMANGRAEVTPDDVAEVCASVPESDTFALSNAITDRNRAKAFAALEEMKMRRVEPSIILAMAQRTYSELLDVLLLMAQGKGAQDIASVLRISPYKVGIYISAAKRHTKERVSEAVEALLRADAESKSGGIGGYTSVELFISEYI